MSCLFSGEETDNDEHVIPRWMQSRYDLYNQTIYIPNGTTLPYRYVKVPAASRHNTKFSEIENRISRGIFMPQEVYLWALKIHVGLLFRDASLKMDRSQPDSETIWNINNFADEVHAFRTLYKIWAEGGSIRPDPFGSVFIVDSPSKTPRFDLIHDVWSGSIVLKLDEKIVFVCLWDQSDGMHANFVDLWHRHHCPMIEAADPEQREDFAYMAHHVWACESAYWLWRQRRSFSFIQSPTSFTLIPPMTRLPGRPPNETELAQFCRTFGLELKRYGGEVGNVFSPLPQFTTQ